MKDKINLELNKKDLKILAELSFIGDWMVNCVRLHDDRVKKYRRVCDVILKQYLNSLSEKEKGDVKTVEELHDYYMDELGEYAEYYDEKTLIPRISKILAEINYPDCGENFMMSHGIQGSAEHTYEEMLERDGFGILKVDSPEFVDRMEMSKEYWRVAYEKSDLSEEERMEKLKALAEVKHKKYPKKETSNKD